MKVDKARAKVLTDEALAEDLKYTECSYAHNALVLMPRATSRDLANTCTAALARIEELEAALEELLEADGALDSLGDRDDNDPVVLLAGARVLAAQLTAASLLAERKESDNG